jgi:hypothetical protein
VQTSTATAQGAVAPALAATVSTPPTIVIGTPFSYQLQSSASGGIAPYSPPAYAASNLPPGVTLSPSGLLSGTATGLPPGGSTYTVSATYTDASP